MCLQTIFCAPPPVPLKQRGGGLHGVTLTFTPPMEPGIDCMRSLRVLRIRLCIKLGRGQALGLCVSYPSHRILSVWHTYFIRHSMRVSVLTGDDVNSFRFSFLNFFVPGNNPVPTYRAYRAGLITHLCTRAVVD